MRPSLTFTLALASLLASARAVRAQAPLAVEVRGGAYVPVASARRGPEEGGRMGAGASFGVAFAIERTGGRHLTLGFSQHRLDCAEDGCGGEGVYVITAWDVGLGFDLRDRGPVPWIRIGVTVPRVERDRAAGGGSEVTALGIGGEVGGGVRVGVGGRYSLNPAVRFGAVNSGVPGGGVLRLRYVVVDLGLRVGF